jgi:hypothetical protein
MGNIYRKTAEGQHEIETRSRQLGPRLRSALIMVDGRRTDEELRKLIALQADEALQALLDQKLIEAVPMPQGRPAARASSAATPVTEAAPQASPASTDATSTRDLPTLRKDAVRAVNDLLGPMGEMVALKLEQSKSSDDLRSALERAVTVIGNARGGAAAVQFARRFIEAPVT